MKLTSKLAGYYKLEAVKEDGSRRTLADWFPNLITNGGLNRIGVSNTYLGYCHVGAGNTAPAVTDTSLASWVAQTSSQTNTYGIQGSSPYYSWQTFVYAFGLGVAAGNLSEVGVGWSASNGYLFSRALILDGEGDPTTITVLSDEYLYVTYQYRRYIPEVDTEDTVDISGTTYTFTGRASLCTTYNAWPVYIDYDSYPYNSPSCQVYDGSIGAINYYPSGSSLESQTVSVAAYVPDSFSATVTYTFSLTQGNLANGVSAILVRLCGSTYQFGLSPDIPKTSDDVLTLSFTVSWARH